MCETQFLSQDGIDVLGCLFMDDGGLGQEMNLSWLDEGLKRVDAVISGNSESASWDREVWGAFISPKEVTVYSLLEASCNTTLDINSFKCLLAEFKQFITTGPT